MKSKLEIKSVFGSVLFTYEAEDPSIRKAVIAAVQAKVHLYSGGS